MSDLFKRIACAALSATLILGSVPAPALAEMAPAVDAEMGVDEKPATESVTPNEDAGEGDFGIAPIARPNAAKDESSAEVVTESDEMSPEKTDALTSDDALAPEEAEMQPEGSEMQPEGTELETQANGVSERESNDSKTSANSMSLDTYIRGQKSKAGDEDWFAFNVPYYGTYTLSFNGETSGDSGYWKLQMWDPQESSLVSESWLGSSDLDRHYWERSIPAGTVYVRIKSDNDVPTGTKYRISLCRQGATPRDDNDLSLCTRIGGSESESNEKRATANLAQLDTFVRGQKSKADDYDWYVFQVPVDGKYTLSFNGETADASGYWKLKMWDYQANSLVSDSWLGWADIDRHSWEKTIPAGTVYVRIKSDSDVPTSAKYRISLCRQGTTPKDDNDLSRCTRIGGTESESNEDKLTANLVLLGQSVVGTKHAKASTNDQDWFAFQVPVDGKYTLSFNGETAGNSGYWKLKMWDYQANSLVSESWLGSSDLDRHSWERSIPAGTVYVRIKSDDAVPIGTKYRISLVQTGYIKTFPDVPKDFWGYDVVHRAAAIGIVSGYSNGNFGPNDLVARGDAAVMLWNMAGQPSNIAGAKRFPDVKTSDYFYKAVSWASSKGIINGYSNNNFGPGDKVTREQLATMIANYAGKFAGKDVSGSAYDYASMKDRTMVSAYAVSSVGWCFKNGVLSGTPDGRINPQGNATRAETAKMILRLYDITS